MVEYIYQGELQEQLNRYLAQHGQMCTLCRAVRDLWEAGAIHRGEDLPKVSFADWDGDNLNRFEQLFHQTALPAAVFLEEPKGTAADSSKLDVLPKKLLENQAPGERALDCFEICCILQGEAELLCDSGSCIVPQGTLCILSPHFRFEILARTGCKAVGIILSERAIDQTLYRIFQQDSVICDFFRLGLGGGRVGYQMFTLKDETGIRRILRSIFDEYYSQEKYSEQLCTSYIEILLTQVLRQCDSALRKYSGRPEKNGVPLLALLKYIQANYRTVSLKETAEWFHYEPSYLGRLLKANLGKCFTDLVRELRLAEAEKLIRGTGLSLEQIAERSGFHSQVHFFREFRRMYGTSPGEYRKQRQWEKEA